jgi:hypothetical protein
MRKTLEILTLGAALICGGMPRISFAALTEYTDLNAFRSAAGATAVDTFSEISFPSSGLFPLNGTTINGITYSGSAHVAVPPLTGNSIDWGTGAVVQFDTPKGVTLSFAPTTSFAALFGSDQLFTADVAISFDGRTFYTLQTNNAPQLSFFGWTSDTPFSFVIVRGSESDPVMDDVTLTAPVAVPEPAMLILVGAALVALSTVLSRKAA